MTAQPYTADQILAAFSKGLKSTRMKAMAQEIAGLANENAALKQQLARLGDQPTIDEIELANEEAARILAEARAQTFVEVARAWKEGHEKWKHAHNQGEFIPSPLRTASVEIAEILGEIGDFSAPSLVFMPYEQAQATLSGNKEEGIEGYLNELGRPENGESITQHTVIELRPMYTGDSNDDCSTGLAGMIDDDFLGFVTAYNAKGCKELFTILSSMGISVMTTAELKISASSKTGSLRTKSVVMMPENRVAQDAAVRLRKCVKVINSIYASNVVVR